MQNYVFCESILQMSRVTSSTSRNLVPRFSLLPVVKGRREPWYRGWDITMLEQFGWCACANMSPRSKVYDKSSKMADAVADDDVTLPRGNVKMFFLFETFSAL